MAAAQSPKSPKASSISCHQVLSIMDPAVPFVPAEFWGVRVAPKATVTVGRTLSQEDDELDTYHLSQVRTCVLLPLEHLVPCPTAPIPVRFRPSHCFSVQCLLCTDVLPAPFPIGRPLRRGVTPAERCMRSVHRWLWGRTPQRSGMWSLSSTRGRRASSAPSPRA